jgi:hypothetical protein
MTNYLFEDNETGDRFFVQEENFEKAFEIAVGIYEGEEPSLTLLGEYDDDEAEWLGYDTY